MLSAEDREKVSGEVLSKTAVVFCTLAGAGSSAVRRMAAVDTLVVDEAAQALEGEVLIALDARPKSCVLVGDPHQLPALTHSAAARHQGYGRSLLERLMKTCNHPFSMLNTQYRMHPAISKFPSFNFYKGAVKDSKSVHARPHLLSSSSSCLTLPSRAVAPTSAADLPYHPMAVGPYCFVDVSHGLEQVMGSKSVRNVAEAETCVSVLRLLVDAVAKQRPEKPLRDCVILTFYMAQKHELEKQVRARGLERHAKVHTVDSFQGSEADVVQMPLHFSFSVFRLVFQSFFFKQCSTDMMSRFEVVTCCSIYADVFNIPPMTLMTPYFK